MSAEELVDRARGGGSGAAAAAAAGRAARPELHTTIVTCMDARIDPVVLFGLHPGDVHVLRNAGGVVTDDVVRSITVSQRKLGTDTVLLVQHTGCGMTSFTDDEFRAELAAATGSRPTWSPGAFTDPTQSVVRGLSRLRSEEFLVSSTVARGFVLDITTFALTEVTEPAGQ